MKKVLLFIPLSLLLLGAGCTLREKGTSGTTAKYEQVLTEENQERLLKSQPPVKLQWSLERENINRRTNLWNDENKISYIYLVNFGKVMAFYPIKGKVSSVNSQITNPMQIVGKYDNRVVIPSPAEDGSYGTNGDSIFFFTVEGVYVEWKGDYLLADQPLQLSTPPELVRQIE